MGISAKKKKFIEEMKETLGNVTSSCTRTKIGRTTFYRWLKDDPEFLEALKEVEVKRKDLAEHHLFRAIIEGDVAAIRFYLERKGGYTEKKQVQVEQTNYNIKIEEPEYEIIPNEIKDKKEEEKEDEE